MKRYEIICPYCFEKFYDDEVHFRVPQVKDPDSSVLPDGIDSLEELQGSLRYSEEQKMEYANAYWKSNFYGPQRDKLYENFWNQFDGVTTEPVPRNHKYPPYWKRIIEPKRDIKLLRQMNNDKAKTVDSCFKRDCVEEGSNEETFVSEIQLEDGTVCSDRVCPKCHNPLPSFYGAYPVKFISIVGITHSGKTVYLSQFLKYFVESLPKVGYTVPGYTPSLAYFVEKNKIAKGEGLPAGTSPRSFQQPVICEISHERNKQTLVMYDVAGELFGDSQRFTKAEIDTFAEFIRHSDAIMMLIDPMQFSTLWSVLQLEKNELEAPNAAVRTLHEVLGKRSHDIPFAVCISKCDEIYDVMPQDLVSILKADYRGIPTADNKRRMQPMFNATEFNSYEEALANYVYDKNQQIDVTLAEDYDNYSYFAISALGCPVETILSERGEEITTPKGPISPKRMMDPFYWLMYKLNLLGASEGVYNPNGKVCPECQTQNTVVLKEPVSYETGFLRKKTLTYTHYCTSCRAYFNPETGDYRAE